MKKYNINFVGKFPVAVVISSLLVLGSIGAFISKGLNYGVDFRGGAEVQVNFSEKIVLKDLRKALDSGGFQSSQVQSIGDEGSHEFLIKISIEEKDLNVATQKVTDVLRKNFPSEFASEEGPIQKTDIVGPKAGERLRVSGFQAMAWAL